MSASVSTSGPVSSDSDVPHALEAEVHRELMSDQELQFSSLVIRRIKDGVCLQGVLEVDQEPGAATEIALRVAGVGRVQNNLVRRTPK